MSNPSRLRRWRDSELNRGLLARNTRLGKGRTDEDNVVVVADDLVGKVVSARSTCGPIHHLG